MAFVSASMIEKITHSIESALCLRGFLPEIRASDKQLMHIKHMLSFPAPGGYPESHQMALSNFYNLCLYETDGNWTTNLTCQLIEARRDEIAKDFIKGHMLALEETYSIALEAAVGSENVIFTKWILGLKLEIHLVIGRGVKCTSQTGNRNVMQLLVKL
ncbi:hypothetical protein BJX65DRAFT_314762 [Aspergillus insuetus]